MHARSTTWQLVVLVPKRSETNVAKSVAISRNDTNKTLLFFEISSNQAVLLIISQTVSQGTPPDHPRHHPHWTHWTIEIAPVKVHHRQYCPRIFRWRIWLTPLTLILKVISYRYSLVQVRQNSKKKKRLFGSVAHNRFLHRFLFNSLLSSFYFFSFSKRNSKHLSALTKADRVVLMKPILTDTHRKARDVQALLICRSQTNNGIWVTTWHVIAAGTFINVITSYTCSIVSSLAGTTEASTDIQTVCGGVAVVWLHFTLVNVHTVGAITDIACGAVQTDVRSSCVLTPSCWVTAVSSFTAFVNIWALHSRSFISFITRTRETAHSVSARGHLMTLTFKAFIHIIACCPIASISISTNTNIRSRDVIAECKGRVARVNLLSAFINICATFTVAPVTSIAQTDVTALAVDTSCIRVTSVRSCCAFIDVITLDSISRKSQWAATAKTAIDVCTSCIWMTACMISIQTFIHIITAESISWKPSHTLTLKWTTHVSTTCIRVTRRAPTFINIVTNSAITLVTSHALTSIWTKCIVADSNNIVANVSLTGTFVNISAHGSISKVTKMAGTIKAAERTWAVCVRITRWGLQAFIHI